MGIGDCGSAAVAGVLRRLNGVFLRGVSECNRFAGHRRWKPCYDRDGRVVFQYTTGVVYRNGVFVAVISSCQNQDYQDFRIGRFYRHIAPLEQRDFLTDKASSRQQRDMSIELGWAVAALQRSVMYKSMRLRGYVLGASHSMSSSEVAVKALSNRASKCES